MEVALSVRFLLSRILFSLTSNFDESLKEELWLCHKYMGLSMDELMKMTTSDRKSFIILHNKISDKEKERLEKQRKK